MAKLSPKLIERVESRIVGIDEASPHLNILVYAQNGVGKTRFAATAPDVLIVDINEKGTRSARHAKGAKVFHVRKWEDITYIYWYLRQGNHQFQSVAIDTLTAMQHLCMSHVLKEAEDRDPNKDPALASRREWGKVTELIKPLLLNFRNLPMHVIYTAQERVVGDEDETPLHMPDMSNANRGIAMGAVDVLGRMYQKEVRSVDKQRKKEVKNWETRMLVGPHEEYVTKDRTGALGRIVRNPTVPMLLEAAELED